jgi:hypothetical protein
MMYSSAVCNRWHLKNMPPAYASQPPTPNGSSGYGFSVAEQRGQRRISTGVGYCSAAEAGWRQGFGVSYGTFVTVSTVMSVTSLAQISHNDWLVTM